MKVRQYSNETNPAGVVVIDGEAAAADRLDESAHPCTSDGDPEQARIAALTDREREVITAVGLGLKNKQIGARLFISDVTVRHHLTSIYNKLEVSDRLELVIYAYRHSLVPIPESKRR